MSVKPPIVSEVVAEFLRQVDEGADVSRDEVLAKHPGIADALRDEFHKLDGLKNAIAKVAGSAASTAPADSADTIIRCPHCNRPVDAVLTETLQVFECGECKNDFSLVRERKWPARINHFDLIDRIGMGGFGTVWKARDVELDRFVALKLPRRTHPDGTEAEQFMQEARTAANLNHPNIVRVLEVGAFEGEVYIAAELIDGDSLSNHIEYGLPEPETLKIAEQLARALAYAHSQRVIHRDLKPQNVILDRSGKPFLTDFGLARQTGTELTMAVTGQILGTPNYMSPEQVRGETADERSDIYSFGVLLYETLTGQVPFRGTLTNVLRRLENEDPVNPRKLNDHLSRDLDTICMKCLEKSPDSRYQSAQEIADELQRVVDRKPIRARPVGALDHALRWSKRNPAVAALSAVAFCAILFVGMLLSSLSAQRTISAIEANHGVLAKLNAALSEVLAEAKSGYRSRIFELIRSKPEITSDPAFHDAVRGIVVSSMGDFAGYTPLQLKVENVVTTTISSDGSLLAIAFSDGRIEIRKTQQLDEAVYTLSDVNKIKGSAVALRFPADSNTELIALRTLGGLSRFTWQSGTANSTSDAQLRIFDRDEEGEPLDKIQGGAISLDGSRVALCDNSSVAVYDTNDGKFILSKEVESLGDASFQNVAITDNGRYLAAGYSDDAGSVGGVMRWDLINAEDVANVQLNLGRQYANGLAFDRHGEFLALGCERTTVYEVSSMEARQSFEGSESAALAFSPNDAHLAIGYISGEVEIRHRKSNATIANLTYLASGGQRGVTFSKQGRHLVVWNRKSVQVVDFSGAQERLELLGHRRGVPAIRFTKDGSKLISTGKDGFVRLWDSRTGDEVSKIELGSQVQCVALDPEQKWMATAKWGKDAKLSIWAFPSLSPLCDVSNELGNICGLQFSPNGKQLAATGDHGLRVWNVIGERDVPEFEPYHSVEGANGKFLVFDPEGQRIHHATRWWYVESLDLASRNSHAFANDRSLLMGFNSMAFTPDGFLAFVNPKGSLEAWDLTSMVELKQVLKLPEKTFAVSTVTTSRQGLLAGLVDGRTVGIWDLKQHRMIYRFRPELNAVWSLAWSPDGDRLAVGLSDGGLTIWDLSEIRKQLNGLGFEE